MLRSVRKALVASAMISSALTMVGCRGSSATLVDDTRHSGPAIAVQDANDRTHEIVVTAPSGGWSVALDGTRDGLGHHAALITITRPNPAYMQTQALVEHRVRTGISVSQTIRVYARTVNHDERNPSPTFYFAESKPAKGVQGS